MKPTLIKTFIYNFFGESVKLNLIESTYAGGNPAYVLEEANGQPFATLSVNIIGTHMDKGRVTIKTWSENEEIAEYILKHTGLFRDTGLRIPCGFTEAQVWERL